MVVDETVVMSWEAQGCLRLATAVLFLCSRLGELLLNSAAEWAPEIRAGSNLATFKF